MPHVPIETFQGGSRARHARNQHRSAVHTALMSGVTRDFVSVPITHHASRCKKSRYSLMRRFSQFSNLLIGNSSLLLRVLGSIGALSALSGFAYTFYTIARVFLGQPIQAGWPSLIVVNLFFGGLILIALSINGEYLLRILENSSSKPAFEVRTVVTCNRDSERS